SAMTGGASAARHAAASIEQSNLDRTPSLPVSEFEVQETMFGCGSPSRLYAVEHSPTSSGSGTAQGDQ
ncbi:MAG: hypothetical protein WBO04_10850, partial [Steroidobacteraceae bacterium]